MDLETAIAELRRCAGTQFDPPVVEHFCQALTSHHNTTLRAAELSEPGRRELPVCLDLLRAIRIAARSG